MNMSCLKKKFAVIILLLGIVLGGCATSPEPYDYYGFDQDLPTGPGELKEGPGLFSGEDGVFTIYKQPVSSKEESAENDNTKNTDHPRR